MKYKMRDILLQCELTPRNFVRCLDEYLNTLDTVRLSKTADGDYVLGLIDYIEYAVFIGDNDLLCFAIDRIRATLLGF